jgi:hypothetical protein
LSSFIIGSLPLGHIEAITTIVVGFGIISWMGTNDNGNGNGSLANDQEWQSL